MKFSQAMRSYYSMYLEMKAEVEEASTRIKQKSKAVRSDIERREVSLSFEAPGSFKPGLPLKVKVNNVCNVHRRAIKSFSEIFSKKFTGKHICRRLFLIKNKVSGCRPFSEPLFCRTTLSDCYSTDPEWVKYWHFENNTLKFLIDLLQDFLISLTYYCPALPFYTPWINKKTVGFSGGIKTEHWPVLG